MGTPSLPGSGLRTFHASSLSVLAQPVLYSFLCPASAVGHTVTEGHIWPLNTLGTPTRGPVSSAPTAALSPTWGASLPAPLQRNGHLMGISPEVHSSLCPTPPVPTPLPTAAPDPEHLRDLPPLPRLQAPLILLLSRTPRRPPTWSPISAPDTAAASSLVPSSCSCSLEPTAYGAARGVFNIADQVIPVLAQGLPRVLGHI